MKKTYLLYYPDMKELAQEIVDISGGKVLLSPVNWNKFDDGWYNFSFNNIEQYINQHVVFLASVNPPEQIFEQYCVLMRLLQRGLVYSLTVVIPFLGAATMESSVDINVIPTAAVVGDLFSNFSSTAGGPVRIVIYDIHAQCVEEYFKNCSIVRKTAISLFKDEIVKIIDNPVIVFSDAGSYKRYKNNFNEFDQAIYSKDRPVLDGDERVVELKKGNPKGRNLAVVDDLTRTFGTMFECGISLVENGAKSVSYFFTHLAQSGDRYKKIVESEKFKYMFLTNSVPVNASRIRGVDNVIVISLAQSIHDTICRINYS